MANIGSRPGTAVPQVYVTDPPAADEPPGQLAAFSTVTLGAHTAKRITMTVPPSSFQAYLGGHWTVVPGRYTLSVGQSSATLPLSVARPGPDPLGTRPRRKT